MLIDSGWAIPSARELLASALASLGHSLDDIVRFLITHVHRDHYTHAVHLRREFGMRVALGIGEQPSLEAVMRHDRSPFDPQVERLRMLGAGAVAEEISMLYRGHRANVADWELPDDWLDGEQLVERGRPAADRAADARPHPRSRGVLRHGGRPALLG